MFIQRYLLQTGDFFLYATERRGSRQERGREREKERARCGAWMERVVAWVINLTVGQVLMRI
jgi:hypothetical protein